MHELRVAGHLVSDEDIAEITGLRPGTIRVRLHRARLFVRKELAKQGRRAAPTGTKKKVAIAAVHPRERNCKQMFAELSDYLDEELDDSLCVELEKHMEGCEPCKAFLSSLEETIRTCRSAPNDRPDERTSANVRRQVLSRYQQLMTKVRQPSTTSKNLT